MLIGVAFLTGSIHSEFDLQLDGVKTRGEGTRDVEDGSRRREGMRGAFVVSGGIFVCSVHCLVELLGEKECDILHARQSPK
jgi:hypothetical protein